MCWKQDFLTLKDLEKRGKRLESIELVGVLRSFFLEEVQPRLESARTALSRAGFQAEIRSTVPLDALGSEDSVLLEVRGGRRSLLSPSLWFRVMPRVGSEGGDPGEASGNGTAGSTEPGNGASRREGAAIGVLFSQPFGGECEQGFPLGFLAPDRLQTQIDRFLVHQELTGH